MAHLVWMFVNEPINPVLSRTVMITIYLDNISPPFLIRMQGYQWSQSVEGMVGTLCIQVTVSLLTFSSVGGNGIRSVVSHHQPDFFHACLRILHAIAPEKNCEMSSKSVERGGDASGTLALRSQGNGTSHISGVGLSEHKAHNWIISRASPKLKVGNFSPGKVFGLVSRNAAKHTEERSQHHARWKLHKGRQPAGRVASFLNVAAAFAQHYKWIKDLLAK